LPIGDLIGATLTKEICWIFLITMKGRSDAPSNISAFLDYLYDGFFLNTDNRCQFSGFSLLTLSTFPLSVICLMPMMKKESY
jgi:hypothetical protein